MEVMLRTVDCDTFPVPVTMIFRAVVFALTANGSMLPAPQPVMTPKTPQSKSRRRRCADLGSSLRFVPTNAAASIPGIQKMEAENTRD